MEKRRGDDTAKGHQDSRSPVDPLHYPLNILGNDLSQAAGRDGPYQLRLLFFGFLAFHVVSIHTSYMKFIDHPFDHWCKKSEAFRHISTDEWIHLAIPKDHRGVPDACSRYEPPIPLNNISERNIVPCDSWEFDLGDHGDSIVSEWNLVCNSTGAVQISRLTFILSIAAFQPIAGLLSDTYGRYPIICVCTALLIVGGFSVVFAKSLIMFEVMRAIVGASSGALYTVSTVLRGSLVSGLELTAVDRAWHLGFRALQVVIMVTTSFTILAVPYLHESPQWLVVAQKMLEAEQVVLEAGRINGLNRLDVKHEVDKAMMKYERTKRRQVIFKKGCSALFGEFFLHRTLIITVAWISLSTTFFLFRRRLDEEELAKTISWSLLVEPLTLFVSYVVAVNVGKRFTISGSFIVSGIFCCGFAVVQSVSARAYPVLLLSMRVIALLGISIAFTIVPALAFELYPTQVRGQALCYFNMFTVTGFFTSDVTSIVDSYIPGIGSYVVAASCVVVGFLVLTLPEQSVSHAQGNDSPEEHYLHTRASLATLRTLTVEDTKPERRKPTIGKLDQIEQAILGQSPKDSKHTGRKKTRKT
ncbi:organic cation transporter 1-like isoform X2 [Ornithodoros turicata]|uniref:organic cation transporter 1-like isoform X2 n=1 Tax=Ornithodoros turicata TaxID=34597 RepID=UPI0031390BA0